MRSTRAGSAASPFRQPKAVFAVAFACVVSFMGIGLVDPILPAIAHDLKASPSDVELLFTSYFAFTGISMLFSSVVASRTFNSLNEAQPTVRQKRVTLGWLTPARRASSPMLSKVAP